MLTITAQDLRQYPAWKVEYSVTIIMHSGGRSGLSPSGPRYVSTVRLLDLMSRHVPIASACLSSLWTTTYGTLVDVLIDTDKDLDGALVYMLTYGRPSRRDPTEEEQTTIRLTGSRWLPDPLLSEA